MKYLTLLALLALGLFTAHAQICGSYSGGYVYNHLVLREDSTYSYSIGACIADYYESGRYSVRNDTVIFSREWYHNSNCNEEDSFSYTLNDQNLFAVQKHKVIRCIALSKEEVLPNTLFYHDGWLHDCKAESPPYFKYKHIYFERRTPGSYKEEHVIRFSPPMDFVQLLLREYY